MAGSEPRLAGSLALALGLCMNRRPEGWTGPPRSERGMSVIKRWASWPPSASQRNCGWKERKQLQLSSGGLGKRREGKVFSSHLQALAKASLCTFSPRHATVTVPDSNHLRGHSSCLPDLPAAVLRPPSSAHNTGLSWSRVCGKKCQSGLGRLSNEGSDPPPDNPLLLKKLSRF